MANPITYGDSSRQAVRRGGDHRAEPVRWTLATGLALGLGLLAAACGGGASPSGASVTPSSPTATPTPAPTPVALSATETEEMNATLAAVTQEILQGIIDQLSALQGAGPAPVGTHAIEPWARQADVSGACRGGGAFFGGSGSYNDESGFVSGQGTLQLKRCGLGGGVAGDGFLMLQGVGTVPGSVSGTMTGDLNLYRVLPDGSLTLIDSEFGILRNWACGVPAGGPATC